MQGRAQASPSSEQKDPRAAVVEGLQTKTSLKRPIAKELEEGIYRVSCPNSEALGDSRYKAALKDYNRQYKRLCTHFRNNASLAERVASGALAARQLAAMDDKALRT